LILKTKHRAKEQKFQGLADLAEKEGKEKPKLSESKKITSFVSLGGANFTSFGKLPSFSDDLVF